MEVSVLKEVGNIIASACLNAFGILLKMTLLPSVPTLISGEAATVLGEIMERPAQQQSLLMIDTVFSIGESPCCGSVFLIPAPESLDALMAALSGK
jgi:chemotaxis protein CheC